MTGKEISLVILAMVVAYLIGSIPFGYVISRLWKGGDIRKEGSGNIGATNVYRSVGKIAATGTLLLDAGKGALAVVIAREVLCGQAWFLLAAPSVVAGHMFPIFIGFRGGKGVATALGAMAVLSPLTLLAAAAVFTAFVVLFRIISLASISSAAVLPVAALLIERVWPLTAITAILALMIIERHRANISRLLGGAEKPLWGKTK